jgi:hypothetical protein
MKGYLWAGSKTVQGGKSLVAWTRVPRPMHLGGLGVVDITLLDRALRVRWLWLKRSNPPRSWAGLPRQVDPITEAFIKASITCIVGNDERTFFLSDPWLDGQSLVNLMPQLVETIPTRLQCRGMVASALTNSAWIRDL